MTFLSFTFLFCACSDRLQPLPMFELTGSTMGTTFSIELVAPDETFDQSTLQNKLLDTLDRIERSMSTYIADSELSQFNLIQSTEWITVSKELCNVIESALDISRVTEGAFDITVSPLVDLWGFGPDGTQSVPPLAEEIADARERVGFELLHLDCALPAINKQQPGVSIDLSAYAKGYAVDQLAGILDQAGHENYLVEIGGELRLRGHNASRNKWRVAVEKPLVLDRDVQATVHLTDTAVATSGDYRNFFDHQGTRYSHTIDPETGYPTTHDVAAVTVVSDSAAFADAIATALLVLGLDEGLVFAEREEIAAYFLVRNATGVDEHMSSRFKALQDQ